MISWDATLSSTKHVLLVRVEGAVAVGGVVEDSEVVVAAVVPAAVEAVEVAAVDATAAIEGIAAVAAVAGRSYDKYSCVNIQACRRRGASRVPRDSTTSPDPRAALGSAKAISYLKGNRSDTFLFDPDVVTP